MKILKNFEEFIKGKVITKRTPDKSRAIFLRKESDRKYESLKQTLEKIGVTELNAHEIVEYCYDILIYLIRAKLQREGFNSGGEGGHEAEVAYLRILGFGENDVNFMNQLRYFRNGIKYYGKVLDKNYANLVLQFADKIRPKLLGLL